MKPIDLSQYQEFLEKVDRKFVEILEGNSQQMLCKKGCYECCITGLTVSPIEAENIRQFLAENPAPIRSSRPEKCEFLGKEGDCQIYPVRPLVCRSQGAPLQISSSKRDACSLNFTNNSLVDLPQNQTIHLDTINTILAALNLKAYGKENSQQRIPLKIETLK